MGTKCFIKCDIHIKDYIAVCLRMIYFHSRCCSLRPFATSVLGYVCFPLHEPPVSGFYRMC